MTTTHFSPRRRGGAPAAPRRALLALALAALAPLATAQPAEFVGLLYPVREAALSVHVAGVVDRVNVAVGQRVRRGQVLLSLDDRLQRIEQERRRIVADDEAELASTEQRRRMLQGLVADATVLYEQAGSVSREEWMKLRMELEAVSGRAEQLREAKKREMAELRLAGGEREVRLLAAPFAGVVTMLRVRPGEWAAPGEAVARLVDDGACEFRVNVSAAVARRLQPGQSVAVRIDDPALAQPRTARVTFVSPVVDAASSLVEVRAELPNPDRRLQAGMKARLALAEARP